MSRIVLLSLTLLLIFVPLYSAQGEEAMLSWDPPTTNVDGTPLTDLSGYWLHCGTTPGAYTWSIRIDNPAATTHTVTGLTPGSTYYFALKAFDASGNQSDYSNEVFKTIPAVAAAPAPAIPVTGPGDFADVPANSTVAPYVKAIALAGVTAGCGEDSFCPDMPVTRAQMAVFIIRSMVASGVIGSDLSYSPSPRYHDVPVDHWAFRFIQELTELGITSGCSADSFCPDSHLTRAEMAVFIVSALHYGQPFTYGTSPYFADVPPGDWSFRHVQRFYELGITSGCRADDPLTLANERLFCGTSFLTRAEMAVFLAVGFAL